MTSYFLSPSTFIILIIFHCALFPEICYCILCEIEYICKDFSFEIYFGLQQATSQLAFNALTVVNFGLYFNLYFFFHTDFE